MPRKKYIGKLVQGVVFVGSLYATPAITDAQTPTPSEASKSKVYEGVHVIVEREETLPCKHGKDHKYPIFIDNAEQAVYTRQGNIDLRKTQETFFESPQTRLTLEETGVTLEAGQNTWHVPYKELDLYLALKPPGNNPFVSTLSGSGDKIKLSPAFSSKLSFRPGEIYDKYGDLFLFTQLTYNKGSGIRLMVRVGDEDDKYITDEDVTTAKLALELSGYVNTSTNPCRLSVDSKNPKHLPYNIVFVPTEGVRKRQHGTLSLLTNSLQLKGGKKLDKTISYKSIDNWRWAPPEPFVWPSMSMRMADGTTIVYNNIMDDNENIAEALYIDLVCSAAGAQ